MTLCILIYKMSLNIIIFCNSFVIVKKTIITLFQVLVFMGLFIRKVIGTYEALNGQLRGRSSRFIFTSLHYNVILVKSNNNNFQFQNVIFLIQESTFSN